MGPGECASGGQVKSAEMMATFSVALGFSDSSSLKFEFLPDYVRRSTRQTSSIRANWFDAAKAGQSQKFYFGRERRCQTGTRRGRSAIEGGSFSLTAIVYGDTVSSTYFSPATGQTQLKQQSRMVLSRLNEPGFGPSMRLEAPWFRKREN
jgi:hypothetical protein